MSTANTKRATVVRNAAAAPKRKAAAEDVHQQLLAEQERELETLNDALRHANAALDAQKAALHREIAERRRVETLLRETDRRKDEFLAALAHELRNPLAPLQNALSLRRLGHRDDENLLGLMERQLALLVRLIDDLLDVARISQSKLTLRKHPTTLQEIIESAIETARPLVEQGGHELSVSLPEASVPLAADQARLSQVFANLLNNAATYSEPRGRIELIANADDGRVQVQVRDTGIGLAPEQLDLIFELFSQVDTAIDRAHGGLGIGLTLVRQLVEMHGGRATVHSEGIGRGATFKVDLPLEPVPEPDAAPAPSTSGHDAAAEVARRVLVVDDNRDAADTLAMMVEMLGHDVRRLYDPHAVLADVAAFRPDIAFLDVGMPGLSGYELARQLRRQPGGDALVLVAVTGWGQPDDRRRTREAGFDQHLVKPPAMDAIVQLCNAPDTARRTLEQPDG